MFPSFVRQRSFGTQLAFVMAMVVTVVALSLTAIVTSMMQAQIERDKGAEHRGFQRHQQKVIGLGLFLDRFKRSKNDEWSEERREKD
jgi:hypothetical protein